MHMIITFVSLSGLFCHHTRKESVNCQLVIIIAQEASGSSVVFSERQTLSESRSDRLADEVFRMVYDVPETGLFLNKYHTERHKLINVISSTSDIKNKEDHEQIS